MSWGLKLSRLEMWEEICHKREVQPKPTVRLCVVLRCAAWSRGSYNQSLAATGICLFENRARSIKPSTNDLSCCINKNCQAMLSTDIEVTTNKTTFQPRAAGMNPIASSVVRVESGKARCHGRDSSRRC